MELKATFAARCAAGGQSDIPFTHGEVSYTYRFSRYVLDLLRMGSTIKDVALHLHVCWNMVKDIHKKYLKSRYSHPDISHVQRIESETVCGSGSRRDDYSLIPFCNFCHQFKGGRE